MIDIVTIKKLIRDGELSVIIVRKNILLVDNQTSEAVKIGEIPRDERSDT